MLQRSSVALGVLLLLLGSTALSQTSTGEISITVLDPSSTAIAGAAVTVTGSQTGNTVRSLPTNDRGIAAVPLLPPGSYDVSVTAKGFKTENSRGINVDSGQIVTLPIHLQLGSTSESVTVVGEAPLVNEESGTLAQVVTQQQIVQLPLNGRDYLNLANLTPGAIPSYGSRDQTFSAYGNTGLQNAFLLDGARNENYIRGLDTRTRDMIRPPLDALSEFTVQTSNYSAQFGAAAGAVVNAITKSGTNELQGSAYDFLRNDHLDAINFFAPPGPRPLLVQNQFGGSLGAPVVKNHAWVFAAYEGVNERSEQTSESTVPSAAQHNGSFGSVAIFNPFSTVANPSGTGYLRTPFPGNTIPSSLLNPIGQSLVNDYPLPNVPGSSSLFAYNAPQLQTSKNGVVRGDVQLTTKDTMSARYSIYRTDIDAYAALPPPAQTPVNRSIDTAGVGYGYTRTFSPTLVNEFRFSWTTLDLHQDGTLPENQIIPGALAPGVDTSIPTFNVSGYTTLGAQPSCCGNIPLTKSSGVWDFSDNMTKSLGAHLLKFGAEFMLIRPTTQAANNARGSFGFTGVFTQNPQSRTNTGNSIADLLLGTANSVTTGTIAQAIERGWYAGEYFQDEWKVDQNLTINLGVRYELFSPYIETKNRMANLILTPGDPLYGQYILAGDPRKPRSLLTTDKKDWAPRVGFAYKVPGAKDLVIRSAFGIFYAQDQGNGVVSRMTDNPPFYGYGAVSITSDQTFPSSGFVLSSSASLPQVAPINPASFVLKPSSTASLVSWPNENTTPYVEEWNFTVEKGLPWNMVWRSSYVGNTGVHIWGTYQGNQPLTNGPGSPTTRRPLASITVAPITVFSPWNMSSYEGMSTEVEKRFSTGVSFISSFTWGHAIDYQDPALDLCDGCGNGDTVQNAYNRRAQRSAADNDVRLRYTLGGMFELPFGRGKRFLQSGVGSAIAGGWQLTAIYQVQTGLPFTPSLSFDNANAGTVSYPNRICSGSLSNPTVNEWFNTSCFATPPQYVFGNGGRNSLRGPGENNIDLSVHRDFRMPVEHATTLQLRIEAFNAINHPQFALPGATVGSSTFGVITATSVANRQVQLAARLVF
jgi:Carboxypeptidase regulatory-like domain